LKNSPSNKINIVSFGEVLWDVLPTHKVAGGAPMNVVFHTNNFGIDARLISSVGNDLLGKELLLFLKQKGISTELVRTNHDFPTSTVPVTLDEKGSASYEIVEPVAWDFLQAEKQENKAVVSSTLLLFGSLICRNDNNIKALFQLIDKAQKTVFDVNLRPPFYSKELIETLLQKADIVKMNDEELDIIAGWYNKKDDLKEQMIFLMEKFDIETLVMTNGKEGAYCMHNNQLFEQKGFPVKVKDTVGSGDSFLAAFLFKMLTGSDWQQCLEFACATGALVAMQSGGTAEINEPMVLNFINERT
jgi:fructokinase